MRDILDTPASRRYLWPDPWVPYQLCDMAVGRCSWCSELGTAAVTKTDGPAGSMAA